MINILKLITVLINHLHDWLILITDSLGFNLNDKQLHFLVIGTLGILLFIIVNRIFKYLARFSITAISFIYTFTVLIVAVFAIEIEQRITHRGNMEFQDIVQGLWGFIVAFLIYLLIKALIGGIKKISLAIRRNRKK